jgi:hypothetical protein
MQLSSFTAIRFVAALGLVLAVGAGCTSSDPGDETRQLPSAPASAEAGPDPSAAPPNAAEESLKKLAGSGAATGSGQLEESVGNALPGRPARAGRLEFLFVCTGRSAVSISIRDGATQIPAASGQHQCGDGAYRKTLTVTTKSQLSFRADASPFTDEGEFAFAFVGDIR